MTHHHQEPTPQGPWVSSPMLLAWNRGQFGEISDGGSAGERWLESEMANLRTGMDTMDFEKACKPARTKNQEQHRRPRRVCGTCFTQLPITGQCDDCQASR